MKSGQNRIWLLYSNVKRLRFVYFSIEIYSQTLGPQQVTFISQNYDRGRFLIILEKALFPVNQILQRVFFHNIMDQHTDHTIPRKTGTRFQVRSIPRTVKYFEFNGNIFNSLGVRLNVKGNCRLWPLIILLAR